MDAKLLQLVKELHEKNRELLELQADIYDLLEQIVERVCELNNGNQGRKG